MDSAIALLLAVGSVLWGLVGVLLIPFSLPGNWVIALVGLLGPSLGLGWKPLFVLLGAAAFAEFLELFLAVRTTKRAGGGRAAQWGAFLGGIVGAIFGTPLIPIPIVGTLLGSACGALAGAVLMEVAFTQRDGRGLGQIGWAAFRGVLFGKGAKMALGAFQVGYWGLSLLTLF